MSVQSLRSPQEPSRLGLAFLTALLLHGAALTAVTLWPHDKADLPGEQEITIDLAPAMEELVAAAPEALAAPEIPPVETEALPGEAEAVEAQPPEEIVEVQPEEPVEVQEPEQVTEAAPVEAVPAEPEAIETETTVVLPPPDAVVAKPLEEPPPPEKKPPPKPVERKPPPRRTVAERRPPPSELRQGQVSSSRENTGGQAASADPNVLNRYKASIVSALRNRLRYPNIASSQGATGIATIRFTMSRSGQIISASLVDSAGHPQLDQAALATARPGSSLPAAPDSIPQQQFTFLVPLRFNLR
jgi:protein TonB